MATVRHGRDGGSFAPPATPGQLDDDAAVGEAAWGENFVLQPGNVFAPLDDLAERVGRLTTGQMLVLSDWERNQVELAGFLTAAALFDVAKLYLDRDVFEGFVERLRRAVKLAEGEAR
jgi:hypothetical protein